MSKRTLKENFNIPFDGAIRIENISSSMKESIQSEASIQKTDIDTKQLSTIIRSIPIAKAEYVTENKTYYPRELWEQVISRKEGENSFGLLDHPEGDSVFAGSVKNIFGIWKNLHIENNNIVYADLVPIGENGKFFLEAVEKNGSVGTSTYGYGESSPKIVENEEVDCIEKESYQLVRAGDWVLNPSFGLYINDDSKTHISKEAMSSTLEKVVNEKIQEAESTGDIEKKRSLLEDASSLLERNNTEALEKELVKVKRIMKEVTDKSNTLKEEGTPSLNLQRRYFMSCVFIEEAKEKIQNLEQKYTLLLSESNGKVDAKSFMEAKNTIEKLKEEIRDFIQERQHNRNLEEELEAEKDDNEELYKKYRAVTDENLELKETVHILEDNIKSLREERSVVDENTREVNRYVNDLLKQQECDEATIKYIAKAKTLTEAIRRYKSSAITENSTQTEPDEIVQDIIIGEDDMIDYSDMRRQARLT